MSHEPNTGPLAGAPSAPGANALPTMPDDAPRFATRRLLSDCVHCGLCLEACPTYRELGQEPDSPRGRLYLMKALADGRVAPDAGVVGHLDLCLGCRACEPACPSGVHYGAVLEAARGWLSSPVAARSGHRPGFRDRFLRHVLVGRLLSDPGLGRLALQFLRLGARLGLLGLAAPLFPAGFDGARLGRALRPDPRVDWSRWPGVRREKGDRGEWFLVVPGRLPGRGRVAFLTGCVMEGLFGRTNEATVQVLVREGYDVVLPETRGCCGALAAHAGLADRAAELGRALARDYGGVRAEALLVNAAGCGAHLKECGTAGIPVFDITEFLFHRTMRTPLSAPDLEGRGGGENFPIKVAYHDACHLAHAQRIVDPPRRLLAAIPGVELVPLTECDMCCGSAGSYNILEPDMAERLGRRKAANLRASGASVVTAANMGCLAQIDSHLDGDLVSISVIELIERATRTPR